MRIDFFKYQGTGNDFVILDNRDRRYSFTKEQVAFLCNRRFGIGADGLMLLQLKDGYDFEMVYYNADGGESSMCGNGGRCLVAFAKQIGLIADKTKFIAVDGEHDAIVRADGIVELKMQDVLEVERGSDYCVLNTGSPHYIQWVNNVDAVDAFAEGKKIRYSERFSKEGINVNFVQVLSEGLKVRTYERGVEDETYSCGTGVTAAALSTADVNKTEQEIAVQTPGGKLSVKLHRNSDSSFDHIWLCGPATFVFNGSIDLNI